MVAMGESSLSKIRERGEKEEEEEEAINGDFFFSFFMHEVKILKGTLTENSDTIATNFNSLNEVALSNFLWNRSTL
jgi:hypothetical protein